MEFFRDIAEALASAAARLWPGVLVAALCGYLGWQLMGFVGFWVGAALGALGGTWAGAKLDLAPVRAATGNPAGDHLLASAGAFAVVAAGYMLLQFVYIVLAAAAVIAIAAVWLSS